MNKYLVLIIAALSGAELQAQTLAPAPRLVVNITIDQLRTDYIEYFAPKYSDDGLRRLFDNGRVYQAASYPFTPVDHASAIATISTGTTPYYNGILSTRWLDRNTLRPVFCVDDSKHYTSPWRLATSTIGDELKVSSHGAAIVWSVAKNRESAVLSAGHAANGAIWYDDISKDWRSSTYYTPKEAEWFNSYKRISEKIADSKYVTNDDVSKIALQAMTTTAMGKDEVSDLLSVTFTAASTTNDVSNWQIEMEGVYMKLDKTLAHFISEVEKAVGKDHVLFVVTSTGYVEQTDGDLSRYNIPTGTFYINRTANLLNMYLSAIYGQGRFVETCFHNQMYLNHKLIEQKRLGISEVLSRCQEFLVQNSGVGDVYTSERLLEGNNDILKLRNGFNPMLSGDIIIAVTPGWKLVNEETQEIYSPRASFVPFPIIFFGAGVTAEHINTAVTTDRIAPTITKAIHIRAPNACSSEPLF